MSGTEQENRIAEVLSESEVKTVTEETLLIFHDFLIDNLELPCEVVVAGEDENFMLDDIQDSGDDLYGILGSISEIKKDPKVTLVPLCDVKALDNRSKNAEILEDYAFWFINAQ